MLLYFVRADCCFRDEPKRAGGMPVATRSPLSVASRDVAAIQESVPSVRTVVLKRGKTDTGRPTSAASSAKSTTKSMPPTPASASSGPHTESFPDTPLCSTQTPTRARSHGGKSRGTRSTPTTPPSHQRLLPRRSLRAGRCFRKKTTPGSGGGGAENVATSDGSDDESPPASPKSVSAHVTQFAESLKALRELGLAGIGGLDLIESRFVTGELENTQMRVLLDERSRARDLVRQLERDKQLQHEQLQLMTERIVQQELTEEEFGYAEEEVRRYREETVDLAQEKQQLEEELRSQIERNDVWSEKLRERETTEKQLVKTATKAEKALQAKELEAELLTSKLSEARMEIDQLRARDFDRAIGAAGGGETGGNDREAMRALKTGPTESKTRTAKEKHRKVVATGTGSASSSGLCDTKKADGGFDGKHVSSKNTSKRKRNRRCVFFGVSVCASVAVAAVGLGRHETKMALIDTVRVTHGHVSGAFARFDHRGAAPRSINPKPAEIAGSSNPSRFAFLFGAEPEPAPAFATSTQELGSDSPTSGLLPKGDARHGTTTTGDDESPAWRWFTENTETSLDENVRTKRLAEPVSDEEGVDTAGQIDSKASNARENRETVSETAREGGVSVAFDCTGATTTYTADTPQRTAPISTPAKPRAVANRHKPTNASPLLSHSEREARATEERGWDASVEQGWAAWRGLGGSGSALRARVKQTARRAELAVSLAKQARAVSIEARAKYEKTMAQVDALAGSENENENDNRAHHEERQRLTLASHEIDAETSGRERRWESLREKAIHATGALETELRGLG